MAREAIREPVRTVAGKTRKRKSGSDQYYIDPSLIPPGVSYEWKREATYGAKDYSYTMGLQENGWEPVPAARHPNFMPPGYSGAIERGGLVLMERPIELTEEARQEDYQNALAPIRANAQRLGEAGPGEAPRTKAVIKTSLGEIPD